MKIQISKEQIEKAKYFANQSVLTNVSKYSQRNQNDIDKIKSDIVIGKLAEEGSYNFLSKIKMYSDISKPDYQIYEAKDKNWDSDLKSKFGFFAVKACRYSNLYSTSWIFQYGDGKRDCDKEIFTKDSKSKFVCFVVVDIDNKFVDILKVISLRFLHENNLFEDPRSNHLKNNKKAVYLSSLEEALEKSFAKSND